MLQKIPRLFILLLIAFPSQLLANTVTTEKINDIIFYPVTSIPGTVVALSNSDISSDISGKLSSLSYEIGNEVKSGDVLAEIECSDYIALKDQAQSNLDAVKAQNDLTKWRLERSEKLFKQQNVSQEEVKKLKSELLEINANIDRNIAAFNNAQTQVNRCKIKAPFDGVVTRKYASLGEYVLPGSQVYRLLDIHNLEIEAEIHQDEIISIKNSKNIVFSLGAKKYPAQIRAILPQQNSSTKMHIIRLQFISDRPVAGSSGRLEWRNPSPHIPVEFIQHVGNSYGIFIVEKTKEGEMKAIFHKLPDAVEGQSVKSNLPAETHVIVKGREKLTDQDLIENIMNSNEK